MSLNLLEVSRFGSEILGDKDDDDDDVVVAVAADCCGCCGCFVLALHITVDLSRLVAFVENIEEAEAFRELCGEEALLCFLRALVTEPDPEPVPDDGDAEWLL